MLSLMGIVTNPTILPLCPSTAHTWVTPNITIFFRFDLCGAFLQSIQNGMRRDWLNCASLFGNGNDEKDLFAAAIGQHATDLLSPLRMREALSSFFVN